MSTRKHLETLLEAGAQMTTPFIKLSISEGKHLEALLEETSKSMLVNCCTVELVERLQGWAKRLRKKHTFGTSENPKILGANH